MFPRAAEGLGLSGVALLALFTFAASASPQELKQRSGAVPPGPASDPAARRPLELPVDLISATRLNPPLRSDALLRFSSNGSRLFIQDQAGIFVLSRKPLQILLYSDIGNAYPAAFTDDSESVSVLGRDLVLTTWQLSDLAHPNRRELPVQHGCLDAQLSPDAAWIACFTPGLVLDLYRARDFERVYSQRLALAVPGTVIVPIARNHATPLSRPMGFMAADFSALSDRGTFRAPLYFAPDAKFLLVNAEGASFRLDLPSLQKSSLPGAIRKVPNGIIGFPSADRVLVSEPKKDLVHQILSLSSGEVVGAASFASDTARLASDRRFALLASFDSAGVAGIFDLEKNGSVAIPPNTGADVFGNELVLLTSEGQLRFYRLGEEHPALSGQLPLGPVPRLQAALADPSLATLLLAVRGAGAAYDLATGNRLAAFNNVEGASFSSPESAFLSRPPRGKTLPGVFYWTKNQSSPPAGPSWSADQARDMAPSRRAFVSYSFHDQSGSFFPLLGVNGELAFQLRGLDPSTGRELWRHPYDRNSPVPFSDPQGGRIVLGWKAHTASAENAASRFPAAREAFKKAKIKEQDTFFEVLDAASGSSLGGVLVQFGGGPASFESAFSGGNFLVLTKDAYRVTVFRLNDGTLLGRFRGIEPALSDAAKLLALDDSSGKLMLYSLETGAKVAERRMPDYVNYLCFSEKGDRLLVFTSHQMVYILDVGKILESFPPAASGPLSEPPSEHP
jgi:hypothetical protein